MRKQGVHAIFDFRGDSLDVLSSFPKPVKESFGFNLDRLSKNETVLCEFRPMTEVGPGVYELKEQDERTWYRLMYLTKVDNVIHVLHCFEKDSNRTSKRDLEIARTRLKQINAERIKSRAEAKRR